MAKMYYAKLTEIEAAARAAIRDTAKEVLAVAKDLVPVEAGGLKRSGRIEVEDLQVRVVFRAPHAWLQHEKTEYKHPHGGQAKYLEAALAQVGVNSKIITGIGARIK